MKAMRTVFVTCGATVPFPQLVRILLSKKLLERVSDGGFSRIVVQYGKGYDLEFQERLEALGCTSGKFSVTAGELGASNTALSSGIYAPSGIEIVGIEFSTKVQDVVSVADLVISHAGTGSILDALRLRKPLIVCVNDELMDNHQQQIANKFQEKGYVWACKPRLDELCECLDRSQRETLNSFPQAFSGPFEADLKRIAYQ